MPAFGRTGQMVLMALTGGLSSSSRNFGRCCGGRAKSDRAGGLGPAGGGRVPGAGALVASGGRLMRRLVLALVLLLAVPLALAAEDRAQLVADSLYIRDDSALVAEGSVRCSFQAGGLPPARSSMTATPTG